MLTFSSKWIEIGSMPRFDDTVLREESMVFASTPHYASMHGKVHECFVDALPQEWRSNDVIIDSRVHMLMKGWYPCIPGWHLDDVPRTRPDKQPDHVNPVYKAEHTMAVIGDASLTEFIQGIVQLPDIPVGQGTIYGKWNEMINRGGHKVYDIQTVKPSTLYLFDWQAFHRGMPATKFGWRIFIRATKNSQRPHFNECRKQTQVYLSAPEAGW
jgi:hypothetical protein